MLLDLYIDVLLLLLSAVVLFVWIVRRGSVECNAFTSLDIDENQLGVLAMMCESDFVCRVLLPWICQLKRFCLMLFV